MKQQWRWDSCIKSAVFGWKEGRRMYFRCPRKIELPYAHYSQWRFYFSWTEEEHRKPCAPQKGSRLNFAPFLKLPVKIPSAEYNHLKTGQNYPGLRLRRLDPCLLTIPNYSPVRGSSAKICTKLKHGPLFGPQTKRDRSLLCTEC